MAENEQYNDDLLDELGRRVAGKALELLDKQLEEYKKSTRCAPTLIEAAAAAVMAGLSAMGDGQDTAP